MTYTLVLGLSESGSPGDVATSHLSTISFNIFKLFKHKGSFRRIQV
jgi:hypothetical protein